MSSTGHVTWVAPERLLHSWLPEYFAPRFRLVDEAFASNEIALVRLGDIVSLATSSVASGTAPEWLVRRRGGTMSIERLGHDEDLSREPPSIALPDECVVVDGMVLDRAVAATFFSARIVGGYAATTRNSYVLAPTTRGDVAWLEAVFSDPLVSAQVDRAALGGVLPRIHADDLLDVRVPRLTPEQRRSTSDLVRRTLAKRVEVLRLSRQARNQISVRPGALPSGLPVLTASTFEERLEQFERFLIDDLVAHSGSGFLCQAARDDRDSDLFVVRAIGPHRAEERSPARPALCFDDDEEVNSRWRRWYWDAESGVNYAVFNAIAGGVDLPNHLVARSIADPAHIDPPTAGPLTLPTFAEYRSALEANRDDEDVLDLSGAHRADGDESGAGELAGLWERLNPGVPPRHEVVSWLRTAFRPALAIRLLREDRAAGAYLIFGADQWDDPGGALAHLEILGERLVAILRQPSEIAEEAARRESLRRLSWMMHQLGGPLTRIGNVVEEICDFADRNPEMSAALLPDEERARARAAMTDLPLDDYTLRARLAKLEAAVEEIRRLRYLIRRYKNAQGELQIAPFALRTELEELAASGQEQLPSLSVRVECDADLIVSADRSLVRTALAEVVSNACRECKVRAIDDALMLFTAAYRDGRIRLAIEDNALPTDAALLPDVFAEDASTYRTQGKGSGLGLAIVKETFVRHGGRCQLSENKTVDGSRRPGVTFSADLAAGHAPEEETHV